ncbi:MAG TPA: AAA family ATPase [Vicinamibacterales bacterium]|nr:AAA family ATPase [Vicinamibacterales bacterium]
MLVRHLTAKNWRNFRSLGVPLGDRVFIAGPNASGKSNLLDVFRFLRDVAKPGGGLQHAVALRGGVSKLRCLAARRYPDIEIEVELAEDSSSSNTWKYGIGIKQEARGHRLPLLAYERVTRRGVPILTRPDADDEKDPLRLTQTHLEQIGANQSFRDIAKFFEATLYLHLVPQLLRHPEAFPGPGLPGDPFGRNFLERIARTSERVRKSRLKRIESALLVAVPQLKNLTYVTDESGVPHLEAVYKHWRPLGARQREDQFSDGTLRLLGLLWSLLDGDSLLLLEEPELSLNAGIVRRLPALIHRLQRQRRRQVIITTHSAELLSDPGIGGEEVLLLEPSSDGTTVEPASSDADIRALLESGMSVADAALPKTMPSHVNQLDLFE